MSRPQRQRLIRYNPEITYFKPAGVPLKFLEESVITLDELEALRLKDMNGLDQQTASKKMNISRVTYQRILKSVYKKIAEALVMGKAIKMEGGNIIMPTSKTYGKNVGRGQGMGGGSTCVCSKCSKEFPHQRGVPCVQKECPSCKISLRGEFCRSK